MFVSGTTTLTATATSFQLLFAKMRVLPNVIHASRCANVHGALMQAYGDAAVEEAPIYKQLQRDLLLPPAPVRSGGQEHLGLPAHCMERGFIAPSCSLAAFLGCSSRVPCCQEQKRVAPR